MRLRALVALALVTALCLGGSAGAGGPAPVKDGRYAGGAKRLFVFFDVRSRAISYVRVDSEKLSDCAVDGPAVFDLETIDPQGRFTLKNSTTFPGNTIKVSGRFVTAKRANGTVTWTTTDNCPAGTYTFDFIVDRYAPAG